MQIDEKVLAQDIDRARKYLFRNDKASSLNKYYEYLGFAQIVYDIFKMDLDSNLFVDKERMKQIELKDDLKNIYILEDIIKSNNKDLIKLSKSFNKLIDKNTSYYLKFNNSLKRKVFSEHDFKDIIESYFSLYGSSVSNLVHKYLNSNLIELGTSNGNCFNGGGAYTAKNTLSKKCYIVSSLDLLSTENMVFVCHELGHVIDYENFVFKQDKKIPAIRDC